MLGIKKLISIAEEAQNKYKHQESHTNNNNNNNNNKQSYFTKGLQENIKNLKNTWKGIKNISLKTSDYTSPDANIDSITILTKGTNVASAFNKYFYHWARYSITY